VNENDLAILQVCEKCCGRHLLAICGNSLGTTLKCIGIF